jgi:hypothetical protein
MIQQHIIGKISYLLIFWSAIGFYCHMILIFIFDYGSGGGVRGNTDGEQVQSNYPALWSVGVWLFQPLLSG